MRELWVTWCCIINYPDFLWKLLHWLLHSSELTVHPLSHLLQRVSHLCTYTQNVQILSVQQHTHSPAKMAWCWNNAVFPWWLGWLLRQSPLTSLMYLISSWRWLTVHSRAITSCCLSEPVLCTTPYTLGPWCCGEDSGTPLVVSPRCWGRQDHTGQVSVATLRWGWLGLSLCLCTRVRAYVQTCTTEGGSRVCVWMHMLHMYIRPGISRTTAAEHWRQEVGNKQLEKVQGEVKVSCFCNPVHELLPFLPIVPRQPGHQWKQMHSSTGAAQH